MTSDLFSATYARGGAAARVDGRAWLAALLEVEAALGRACVAEDLIPQAAGDAIAAVCGDVDSFDLKSLAAQGGDHATPVVPLVRELRERLGPEYESCVHLGATSQDIVDTAMMLVTRRALDVALEDADGVVAACAALARSHRDTVMTGRTLLQGALPTSFGLVAAGWLVGVDSAVAALSDVRDSELAVQMGGAVGTRAPAVAARVAAELGLAEPIVPWHTDRGRMLAVAGGIGRLSCALSKMARDVTLMSQTEVSEVREGVKGRGGSSAMPHKRNPVAAVSVLACCTRVPGLVATLMSGAGQEYQRAAGGWQAEWGVVSELLTLCGSACAWVRDLLENLEVDVDRMRSNLAALAAEGVSQAASPEENLNGAAELIERALRRAAT